MVQGLRAEHIKKRKGSYDITANWNKPALQPDNYTLQIDSSQFEPRLLVVPGVSTIVVTHRKCQLPESWIWTFLQNAVEAFFLNVDMGPRYDISIVAESMGGVSLPSSILKNIDEEVAGKYAMIATMDRVKSMLQMISCNSCRTILSRDHCGITDANDYRGGVRGDLYASSQQEE